jgi:hypothetical protein
MTVKRCKVRSVLDPSAGKGDLLAPGSKDGRVGPNKFFRVISKYELDFTLKPT